MAVHRAIGALVVLLGTGGNVAAAGGPQPGTTVTAEQVSEVADLVLPGVADAVRRGMRLDIVEPKVVRWRRAYAEATEKHASQVRLGADGVLLDYVAGLPFPAVAADDPNAGTKVMWNHACGPWRPDDLLSWTVEWQFGKVAAGRPMKVVSEERNDSEHSKWLSVVGRTEVPPIPTFPDSPDRVRGMEIFGPTLPVLLTMLRSGPMLTYRYFDLREDDAWYYVSAYRKTIRLPPQLRYDATGGVVSDLNSAFGFNGPVGSYTWKLVGEREMFGVLHARRYPAEWCPGGGDFSPCDAWERRRVYLVEGIPRRPYDIYGKRLLAIDKEAWVVLASDLLDKDGKLWKTVINYWSYRPDAARGAQSEERPYLLAGSYLDHLNDEANRWRFPGTRPLAETIQFDTGLTKEMFTTSAISGVLH